VGQVRRTTPVYLILTGGLGNQLFQIAAALDYSKSGPIFVDWKIASPRLNDKGLPEITSLSLPDNITFLEGRTPNYIYKKIFGFLLRSGLKSSLLRSVLRKMQIYRFIGNLTFSVRYRKFVRVSVAQSLGYSRVKHGFLSPVMIGYYQSCNWTESSAVLAEMEKIQSIEKSIEFTKLERRAQDEKPLIVHLRLGDYKNEPSFGLLSRRYYEKAILLAQELYEFGAIWVFSDEIETARKIINFQYEIPIRFIEGLGESASTNFDAMRLGHGFVIANSSFSWWAARLSKKRTCLVIAPKPWFLGVKDDETLIPSSWLQIEGHDPIYANNSDINA
jgi:hypothetical protein